ncbi:hypothetical protein DSO57_1011652 [Entomophthora muscae]|uniref:Uncharacterized protein n=1 Tax=Entomophthora muscae TaxID=34485 RepID=A0ACC2S805_9FUNG|nr:hypothetical protein DSO57_1011652 [Entomophthora muscae]
MLVGIKHVLFNAIIVSFSFLYGAGLGQWTSAPDNLVPYLGQAKFVTPASCLGGQSSAEIHRVGKTNSQEIKGFRDIDYHEYWNETRPFFYNRALVFFLAECKLKFPAIKTSTTLPSIEDKKNYYVVRLTNNGKLETRAFKRVSDKKCLNYHTKHESVNVGLGEPNFSNDLFCLTEKSAPKKNSLGKSDLGAPAFTGKQSDVTVAGIYTAKLKRKKRTIFFFTKVADI